MGRRRLIEFAAIFLAVAVFGCFYGYDSARASIEGCLMVGDLRSSSEPRLTALGYSVERTSMNPVGGEDIQYKHSNHVNFVRVRYDAHHRVIAAGGSPLRVKFRGVFLCYGMALEEVFRMVGASKQRTLSEGYSSVSYVWPNLYLTFDEKNRLSGVRLGEPKDYPTLGSMSQ